MLSIQLTKQIATNEIKLKITIDGKEASAAFKLTDKEFQSLS